MTETMTTCLTSGDMSALMVTAAGIIPGKITTFLNIMLPFNIGSPTRIMQVRKIVAGRACMFSWVN